jgi:hypothetical protein
LDNERATYYMNIFFVNCRPYKRATYYMNIFFCVLPALQARHVLHEHLFCVLPALQARHLLHEHLFFVYIRPYKRATCYMNIFFCVLPALQARHVLHEHLFLCIAGPTSAPRAKWTSFFVYCRPYKRATFYMDIFVSPFLAKTGLLTQRLPMTLISVDTMLQYDKDLY